MESSESFESETDSAASSLLSPTSVPQSPKRSHRFGPSNSPSSTNLSPEQLYEPVNLPSAYKIESFKTTSTRRRSLLLAPIELQKRIVLDKLRSAKTRGLNERWEAEASAKIVRAERFRAKRERVELEKKKKADAAKAKVDKKERKRIEEVEQQLRYVSLKRHAREDVKKKKVSVSDLRKATQNLCRVETSHDSMPYEAGCQTLTRHSIAG